MSLYKLDEEEIAKWQRRIKLSRQWRSTYEDKWNRNRDYYRGLMIERGFQNAQYPKDEIVVNLVYALVRVVIPAIYAKNPEIRCKSRTADYQKAARAVQQVTNYFITELDLKKEVKLCILDFILCGHAWIKNGWQTTFKPVSPSKAKKAIDAVKNGINRVFGSVQSALGVSPRGTQNEDDAPNNYEYELDERIEEEFPWLCRTSPWNVLVPAYSERPETLRWVTEQLILPTAHVKDNPKYKNTATLAPSALARELINGKLPREARGSTEQDLDEGFSLLYEIYDGETNTWFTLADGHDKPLTDPVVNEYSKFMDSRFPHNMLRSNEISDEFYPMDDITPWLPQQRELNALRTSAHIHRKRFNRKYVINGEVDAAAENALKHGEDGAVAKLDGVEDVRKCFMVVEDAPLSPDVYRAEVQIRQDINQISGASGYQMGDPTAQANTATEASIVEANNRSRVEERIDTVATFAGRIARNISQLCLRYMSTSDVAMILGAEHALDWPKLSGRRIKREFYFETLFGSNTRITPEIVRAQTLQLYPMIANDQMFNPERVRIELLEDFQKYDYETWLRPEIVQQIKQRNMEDAATPTMLLDAYGRPSSGGSGGGLPVGAVSSVGDLRSGIRRPGGRGGSPMPTGMGV